MRNLFFSVLLSSLFFACTAQDVKIDVKQSQSHYKLAVELAQLNLLKNALEEFDLAIKFNPEDPKLYRKKGIILFGMKNYEGAKTYFYKTIDLNPKAIEYYLKAIAYEPTNSTYLNNLGDSYRLIGNLEKAEETLLNSLEVDTNGMLTHFNLGILYQTEGKFGKAIDSFQKSLNINPFYIEAYYQIATTHLKTKNKASAKQFLEKAIQADPDNLKFQELYNKVLAS